MTNEELIADLATKGFRVHYWQGAASSSGLCAKRRADGAVHHVHGTDESAKERLHRMVKAQWDSEMTAVPGCRMSAELERLCSLAVHGEEPPGFNAADR